MTRRDAETGSEGSLDMDRPGHWEGIYAKRRPDEVSWYQPHAVLSRTLIEGAAPDRGARIVDVGGGASMLADDLLAAGYRHITVMDLSASALDVVRRRLGDAGERLTLLVGDVTRPILPSASCDVWHDRAVFHFLTEPEDRRSYLEQVRRVVIPGGVVLVATFAEDGPTKCSGLEVMRYSPSELHAAFGDDFRLLESRREEHLTPSGGSQHFTYCLCRFEPTPGPSGSPANRSTTSTP